MFSFGNESGNKVFGSENISIYVDDEIIQLPEEEQQPYIDEEDRTQVPVRFVSEALGGDVSWDGEKQKIEIERDDDLLVLHIGDNNYTLNGTEMEMDTAPTITDNDRTMVPLRFVSEGLGEDVDWNSEERSVYIETTEDNPGEEPDTDNPDEDESNDTDESDIDPEEISKEKALVTAGTLNVRDGPGTDNENFDQVHEGDVFEILERHTIEEDVDYKEWIMINITGDIDAGEDGGGDEVVEGWISTDFVKIIEPKSPEEDESGEPDETDEEEDSRPFRPVDPEPDDEPDDDVAGSPDDYSGAIGELTIGANSLNVRKGPGLEYPSITQVDEGESYEIFAKSKAGNHPEYDEWIKFKLDDGSIGWSAAEYIKETNYNNNLDEVNFIEYSENSRNTEIRLGPIKRTPINDFSMDNPDRFVFDLKDISLADNIEEEIAVNSNTVNKIRTGERSEDNSSRITLDLNKKEHYTIRWENSHLVIRTFEDGPLIDTKIIIDPGHGGSDTGARGSGGLAEKEVVLDVSLMVRDMLEELGADVRMTRETDKEVSLDSRVDFATENDGDVFVSVHANAHPSSSIKGTETFYSSNRNPMDFELAQNLQDSLLNNLGTINRGVKDRNFRVIRYATMPAALVEIAFLSNADEEELLKDDGFRKKSAEGIVQGLLNYHRNNDMTSR
ncbi:N-acetylmuramoyl-L-alanine amidase [Natranaerofaba carboxydovora]|uniref:N-acetylmuramoyl-L-alanine amidase n=1 Tax=Natranaerofaba carboxydovora TaxID=2742683 RepID=UPI001F1344CA|nr:N-acetylmuramoyl-L-alanine amidase [Natranaerofaba carboxydovora]